MSAQEVIVEAIEPILKDHKLAIKVANAAFTAADNAGYFTTDDDHLALLRTMRKRIAKAVADEETPARDLASLTRRLQDVSREATTLEEKQRQEGRGKDKNHGNSDTGSNAEAPTTGKPFVATTA